MEWEARTLKIANPGFLEQIRAKRKRREAQHPVIAPLVIACLVSVREGKFFKEEKEEFGPLPACYATKDSCFLPVIRRLIANVISFAFLSFEHYLCTVQRKML